VISMVRLSKTAKARLKRKNSPECKKIRAAARLLADEGIISHGRWAAVDRACKSLR